MVRIKKTVAKLESDIIDEIKRENRKEISDIIALKSEEFLENQRINEQKNLREEKLAVEQRKYDEQLIQKQRNESHMNSMNYYIPHVDSSHHYRPNYPQVAYSMKWVRFFSKKLSESSFYKRLKHTVTAAWYIFKPYEESDQLVVHLYFV